MMTFIKNFAFIFLLLGASTIGAQNVGIGEPNPQQKLQIDDSGSGLQTIRVEDLATGKDGDFGQTSGGNMQTNNTSDKVVYVDGNGDMKARYAYGDNIQSAVLSGSTLTIPAQVSTDILSLTFTPRHSTVYLSFCISGYDPLSQTDNSGYIEISYYLNGGFAGAVYSLSAEQSINGGTRNGVGAATATLANFPVSVTPGVSVTVLLRGFTSGPFSNSSFIIPVGLTQNYITVWD